MPTGSGKSLCFQLPALINNGVSVVVSPLISLVEDQIWMLKSYKIRAETLNASSSKEHVKQTHSDMTDSTSDLKILYVTPEKLAKSKMFMNKLEKMYKEGRFARLVIDEVHCCSTYGHDFRPDYKFLGIMKNMFPNVPILGLTATATQVIIEDIKKILNIPKCVLFKASFNRPNIYYEVRNKPSDNEQCMTEIANVIRQQFPNQSGIVYCFSQRESEEVAQELRSRGISADFYHAQIDPNQRSRVHQKWLRNEVRVIVATIAFGMGIDKGDCRFVIHHSMSKSLENFYQESGRCGRDGQLAHSILFYKYTDIFRQSCIVFTEQTGLENLFSMVEYCVNHQECKRTLISNHFDQFESYKKIECNGMCDFCKRANDANESRKINCIKEANLIIEILSETDKKFTANKLAEVAYSKISAKAKKKEFENKLDQMDIECLIIKMLTRNHIRQDFHFTPYSTYCYLILGESWRELNRTSRFELSLKENSSRNIGQASAKRNVSIKKEIQKEDAKSDDIKEEIVLSDTEDDPDFEIIETSKKAKYV